jgi:hypothetical protein
LPALSGVAAFIAIGTTNTYFSARAGGAKAANTAAATKSAVNSLINLLFIAHRLPSAFFGVTSESDLILFHYPV